MDRRLLIPTEDQQGIRIAHHFGRAPYFVIVDVNDEGIIQNKTIQPNTGEHSGGRGHAHDNVLRLHPHVVIVRGMGPRGLSNFQNHGIAVLSASSEYVDDLVTAYSHNELNELTQGCADAHHQ